MEATLTLHQAGDRLGVDDTDLSRLIRIGALPEARKVDRPDGRVWVIPQEHLPAIASRNGWTIDLRDDATDTTTLPGKTAPSPATEQTIAAPVPPTTAKSPGPSSNRPPSADAQPADVAAATQPTTDDTPPEVDAKSSVAVVTQPQIDVGPPAVDDRSGGGADDGPAGQGLTSAEPQSDQGALVPHRNSTPQAPQGADAQPESAGQNDGRSPNIGDVMDLALLDRLLATHEDRVTAQVREQETRHALAALNDVHNRTTGELDIERRERMATADRYREERRARAVADAKVAELRDRVMREMALAEAEKQARTEALNRSLQAEREAANAIALLGRRARRRYRKINETGR